MNDLRLNRREVEDILALSEDFNAARRTVDEVRTFLVQLGPGEAAEHLEDALGAYADQLDATVESLTLRREIAGASRPNRATAVGAFRLLRDLGRGSHDMREFILGLHMKAIAREDRLAVVGECSTCFRTADLAPIEGRHCRVCVAERLRGGDASTSESQTDTGD